MSSCIPTSRSRIRARSLVSPPSHWPMNVQPFAVSTRRPTLSKVGQPREVVNGRVEFFGVRAIVVMHVAQLDPIRWEPQVLRRRQHPGRSSISLNRTRPGTGTSPCSPTSPNNVVWRSCRDQPRDADDDACRIVLAVDGGNGVRVKVVTNECQASRGCIPRRSCAVLRRPRC